MDIKKRIFFVLGILILLSIEVAAQDKSYSFPNSERIISNCNRLKTNLTNNTLVQFIDSMKVLSEDGNELCLNSLDQYNNCMDSKETVYPKLLKYMDDLIGIDIQDVQLQAIKRPWEDEDYYSLRISFHYINKDSEVKIDENFDTIIFGVNQGKIKNIIYAREWINFNTYGM